MKTPSPPAEYLTQPLQDHVEVRTIQYNTLLRAAPGGYADTDGTPAVT